MRHAMEQTIVNGEEGLEAGGVSKICYCSMSRDNTGALKANSVIGDVLTWEVFA